MKFVTKKGVEFNDENGICNLLNRHIAVKDINARTFATETGNYILVMNEEVLMETETVDNIWGLIAMLQTNVIGRYGK